MTLAPRPLFRVDKQAKAQPDDTWPILVVDDDDQVLAMTRVLLRDFQFDGKGFAPVFAQSAAQAREILAQRRDFPVILLDVVMENPHAGLELVRHIREDLQDRTTRIILRTGQPGEAPERDVIIHHDVNDYKAKAELTAQKLFTSLVGAIRAWRDLVTIAQMNVTLEAKVQARTMDLQQANEALARAKDRAEIALSRETEAKGQLRQFLSMVSHEFRTPLAIIDSAAQMLLLKAKSVEPSMAGRLDTIRGAVQRLVDLLATLLAEEQLESGRIVLHEADTDLTLLLRQAVQHHRAVNPSREINLSAEDLPPVWGDGRMLGLVFNNLVGNALKYSPSGLVEIHAWQDQTGVSVQIRDQGIGIPAEDLPRIFERFFRARNTQKISGSGIGLHMVAQIVALHGGTISVDSQLDQGTTLTVNLRQAPRSGRSD